MNNFGQNEWKSKNQLTFFFLINIIRIVWNVSWGNRIESREKKWVKSFEVFCHSLGKILRLERERERDGSRANVHTGARAVLTDGETQSESCFGVLVPLHRHHFVLYTRCYARQLRSTGTKILSIFDLQGFVVVVVVVEFSISICQFVFFFKLSF